MRYQVAVKELHIHYYEVEAVSARDAFDKVNDLSPGVVDTEYIEYSHNLRQEDWDYKLIKD